MATPRKIGIITSIEGLQNGILIQSLDFTENVESGDIKNEKGETVDIFAYSKSKTVSITGVMDTSKGELAKAGDVLTFDGGDWLIESVSRRESNTTAVEITISAKCSDKAIISPLATTETE